MAARGGYWPSAKGGGGAPPGYTLITGWGSLNDAGAAADVGSAMSAGTGTLVTKVGDILQKDGFQEDFTGWDIPLTSLYPDWDDNTDRLDLCLEIAAMPLTTAKWGWGVMVSDAAYASRATMGAKGLMVFPNSATVTQAGEIGATGTGTANNNGTNTNVVTQIFGSWSFDATGVPRVIGRTKRTTDQGEISVVQSPPAALASAANRRINLAAFHVSVTGGAVTMAARVYHRRIRTTGPFV